jgi:DNA-binding CsgD family transcriptional regulator/predicted outer membrane lipoprotein
MIILARRRSQARPVFTGLLLVHAAMMASTLIICANIYVYDLVNAQSLVFLLLFQVLLAGSLGLETAALIQTVAWLRRPASAWRAWLILGVPLACALPIAAIWLSGRGSEDAYRLAWVLILMIRLPAVVAAGVAAVLASRAMERPLARRAVRILAAYYLAACPVGLYFDLSGLGRELANGLRLPLTPILYLSLWSLMLIGLNLAWTGSRQRLPGAAGKLGQAAESAGLSPREREVLGLVCAGKGNKAIAAELSISEQTVKTHVSSILRKTGRGSRMELFAWVNGQP